MIEKNFDYSLNTTKKIMDDVLSNYEIKGDLNQLKVQIHPIISNDMYNREKELLERERFRTIQNLSRVLSDEEMEKVIKQLGFRLILQ